MTERPGGKNIFLGTKNGLGTDGLGPNSKTQKMSTLFLIGHFFEKGRFSKKNTFSILRQNGASDPKKVHF